MAVMLGRFALLFCLLHSTWSQDADVTVTVVDVSDQDVFLNILTAPEALPGLVWFFLTAPGAEPTPTTLGLVFCNLPYGAEYTLQVYFEGNGTRLLRQNVTVPVEPSPLPTGPFCSVLYFRPRGNLYETSPTPIVRGRPGGHGRGERGAFPIPFTISLKGEHFDTSFDRLVAFPSTVVCGWLVDRLADFATNKKQLQRGARKTTGNNCRGISEANVEARRSDRESTAEGNGGSVRGSACRSDRGSETEAPEEGTAEATAEGTMAQGL
eukprot:s4945_g9.t1